ncbi:MAG: hypothetical protein VB081_03950 [Christensenella sp.]|uniref:hypothetical protein n=1 Tax=Christensenella sp. TaxID=1935934 RepID=UPI002B1F1BAF|nr:hypothetical protein [Christensenella sp.]MEA5002631.1 hypothetical protein [Christensenella sp.]
MTTKFYLGYTEVPEDVYEQAKLKAIQEGNEIAGEQEVDGKPEYTLKNGTIIIANRDAGFNRVENGELKEAWQVGTANNWAQGESLGTGKAEFFFQE